MKNYTLLLMAAAGAFSLSCLAQRDDHFLANTKSENTLVMSDKQLTNEFTIVSYRVEEKIRMNFGSSTSTYTVSDLSLVNTNDLGPNNSRIVTPNYGKTKVTPMTTELQATPINWTNDLSIEPVTIKVVPPPKGETSITINILNTYERVLEKGYLSVEMLKRVGDKYFFEGNLETAARWYCELFEITSDLEPVYYYRYAKSLLAINETEKGNAMMALYETKKLQK